MRHQLETGAYVLYFFQVSKLCGLFLHLVYLISSPKSRRVGFAQINYTGFSVLVATEHNHFLDLV